MTFFDERFSLSQQIEEVKREIAMRKRVYPSFVIRHKMTQTKAEFHISRMEAVLDTLERLAGEHD
jgi:hypothetical protein